MKVVVSRQALREYLREVMENPGFGWQATGDLSTSPVSVSAVVDPSAAATVPDDPKFRPQNRAELKAALSSMIDGISDDSAADVYLSMKDATEDAKDEEEAMKDDKKKVEEAVRAAVRKMLKEAGPYRDTGMSYSGPMIGSTAKPGFADCETCEGEGYLPDGNECEACRGTGEVKVKKNVTMTDVGGATLPQIATAIGQKSHGKVQSMIDNALEKTRKIMAIDPDEFKVLTLTAMTEYIEALQKTGTLSAADVQLMSDHPNIVKELDGFREFLDKFLKKHWKKNPPTTEGRKLREAEDKKKPAGERGPICPDCGKAMKPADRKEFESNGGHGYPRICTRCAESED